MPDDDSRTAADAATGAYPRKVFESIGIDPDMPYSQFRRRLEMGERAEQALAEFDSGQATSPQACLDYIRGQR